MRTTSFFLDFACSMASNATAEGSASWGELLDRPCPERVASGHDDGHALVLDTLGYLRNRGGLTGPVDADEHDDGGPLLLGEPTVEVELVDLQDIPHGVLDGHLHDLLQRVGAVVFPADQVLADPCLDLLDDGVCDIRLEQDYLQLVEDLVERVLLDLLPGVRDHGGRERLGCPLGLLLLLLLELQHLLPGELRLLHGSRGGCRFRFGSPDRFLCRRYVLHWGRCLLGPRDLGCGLRCRGLLFGLLRFVDLLLVKVLVGLGEKALHLGLEGLEHCRHLHCMEAACCLWLYSCWTAAVMFVSAFWASLRASTDFFSASEISVLFASM